MSDVQRLFFVHALQQLLSFLEKGIEHLGQRL
jgi:hypothetical protein